MSTLLPSTEVLLPAYLRIPSSDDSVLLPTTSLLIRRSANKLLHAGAVADTLLRDEPILMSLLRRSAKELLQELALSSSVWKSASSVSPFLLELVFLGEVWCKRIRVPNLSDLSALNCSFYTPAGGPQVS